MAIQIKDQAGNQWIVIPSPEYVDGKSGNTLLEMADRLGKAGALCIAFDMTTTQVVNSVGISRLIEVIESNAQRGGRVAFCTARPILTKTFKIMGLLGKAQLVSVVDDLANLT